MDPIIDETCPGNVHVGVTVRGERRPANQDSTDHTVAIQLVDVSLCREANERLCTAIAGENPSERALVVWIHLDALLHEGGHSGGASGLECLAHPLGNLLGTYQVDTVAAILEMRHSAAHPLWQFVRQGRGRGNVAVGRDERTLCHAAKLP